eukprot:CAMPEP_0194217768 /NCGR_PEP_ID=MMETSP0156-20130528/22238_1 /TAXON_ID=33649 /ORGANISM="Thalassionema nitzschioides, Strain L26-B" /LENGTH=384 /DNA_ID=CAMNT_0038946899 /DNA_START=49 /DNA_END=1203 /DNA_ORIENTATION=-
MSTETSDRPKLVIADSTRPKLVQEGKPLEKPVSSLGSANASKPKYRLVVGGEDENEPLPDDPEQEYFSNYNYNYNHNNNNYNSNYRGGGRGYYRGGRNNSYGGGGRYGGYGMRPHGGTRRKIIKNPKAPGLIHSRIVIGNEDGEVDYPEEQIDEAQNHHRIESMDVEQIIPQTYNAELHSIESMEGVVSLDAKEPLVVMDGANVAHAYADVATGKSRGEPDFFGLQVAANYFLEAGVRVLIVLPAPWFRVKPQATDLNKDNAMMVTEKVEILRGLKEQGLLVTSPPRDDDDAYALTIARRERDRAKERGDGGAGYVLSNDMFRDAIGRDAGLEHWLKEDFGRMSYAFCDLGTMNEFGQHELDFIPNPRHPMVAEIERQRHSTHQ